MDTVRLSSRSAPRDAGQSRHLRSKYPVSCWWVAATTEEVTRKPISRWLLEQPVVLYRTESGEVTALQDRCAHRWAPLSQGRLLGDEIACPYHGFRYNTRGACTHIPTQSHVPAAMKIRSYPVCENGPFVWIWMGDPAGADRAVLPEISWSISPIDIRFGSYAVSSCSYVAAQENLMDLSHGPFLHGSADTDWLQYTDSLQPATNVEVTERGLVRTTTFSDMQAQPLDAVAAGLDAGTRVNVLHKVIFMPPGCFLQEHENEVLEPLPGARARFGYRGLHCTTPISPNRCHWWWAYTYNYGHQSPQEFKAPWERILNQDRGLLAAIQSTIEQDIHGADAPELLVVADRTVGEVRRMLREMIEAESL